MLNDARNGIEYSSNHFISVEARSGAVIARCPYRKPHPASEQTANRVMFVPDDRFSHVAGMRADQALPIEGTA
jgi:hypothetical protein